jgi:hypothetical protein
VSDEEEFAGYIVEYDPSKGEVVERFNGTIQAAVEVRKRLMDKALRYAVIAELENHGYTVIAPEGNTYGRGNQ